MDTTERMKKAHIITTNALRFSNFVFQSQLLAAIEIRTHH